MKSLICLSIFLACFFSHQAMSVFIAKDDEVISIKTRDATKYIVRVVDFQEKSEDEVNVVGVFKKGAKRLYSIIYIGIASHDKNILEQKVYERKGSHDLIWPDRFKLCNLKLVRQEKKRSFCSR